MANFARTKAEMQRHNANRRKQREAMARNGAEKSQRLPWIAQKRAKVANNAARVGRERAIELRCELPGADKRQSSRTDAQCEGETTHPIQVSTELVHNALKAGAVREKSWAIQSVLIGDGSVGGDGTWLAPGVPYASAATNGDHSSYWQVEKDTLKVFSGGVPGARSCSWRARALSKTARKQFGKNCERIDNPSVPAEVGAEEQLWEWCDAFRGAAVTIGGPKSRSISALTKPFLVKTYGPLLQMGIDGNCIQDALVNALSRVLGPANALSAQKQIQDICNSPEKFQIGLK
eukprot:IDg22971t1